MDYVQDYWVQITGVFATFFGIAKWFQSQQVDIRRLHSESIDNLSKYMQKPISEMSCYERFFLSEAIRNFYKGSRISIHELSVLLNTADPSLAIESFLRYQFYLCIQDGKVIYKQGVLAKLKIFRFKTPFYKFQVKNYALFFVSASASIVFALVALDRVSQLDSSNLNFSQAVVGTLTESLLSLGYSIISSFVAYISLIHTDKPPNRFYISKVFSGMVN